MGKEKAKLIVTPGGGAPPPMRRGPTPDEVTTIVRKEIMAFAPKIGEQMMKIISNAMNPANQHFSDLRKEVRLTGASIMSILRVLVRKGGVTMEEFEAEMKAVMEEDLARQQAEIERIKAEEGGAGAVAQVGAGQGEPIPCVVTPDGAAEQPT